MPFGRVARYSTALLKPSNRIPDNSIGTRFPIFDPWSGAQESIPLTKVMHAMSKGFLIAIGLLLATVSCARQVLIMDVEAPQVTGYHYIGPITETADPGRIDAGILKHYFDTTGIRQRIRQRAASQGATHIVWLYDYPTSAAALAYRSPAPSESLAQKGWEPNWMPASMLLYLR
jgi:hypothetical protein